MDDVSEEEVKHRDIDGGWAWVALVTSVLNLGLQSSLSVAVAFLQVEFLEAFSGSKAFIALIGGLCISGQTLLGPISGILTSVYTPRVTIMAGGALICAGFMTASFSKDLVFLLVFFGIVPGVGSGLSYTPSVTVINNYFRKYRVVAYGISLAAPGMGNLTVPYLLRWVIQTHGWRFAMVVFGCFMAQTCVLGALFFPVKHQTLRPACCLRRSKSKPAARALRTGADGRHEDPSLTENLVESTSRAHAQATVGSRTTMHVSDLGSMLLDTSETEAADEVGSDTLSHRLKRLMCRTLVWVMCLNQVLLMAGVSADSVLFPAYAQSVGVPFKELPLLYTVFGVTVIICRVACGFIFNQLSNKRQLLQIFFCFQAAFATVLFVMPFYGVSLATLLVFKFLKGLTYGPAYLLVTPILIHYLGLEELAVAFGVIMLCCGIGYVIAPPFGGLMYDIFGNYRVAYYIAGCTVGMAALSLLLLLLAEDLQPTAVKKSVVEVENVPRLLSALQKNSDNASPVMTAESADGKSNKLSDGLCEVRLITDLEELRR